MTTSARLTIETSLGVIEVAVDTVRCPVTSAYVADLVMAGHFDGSTWYRSTHLEQPERGSLIQGGPLAPIFTGSTSPVPQVALLETIESTASTGFRHRPGTVSLARDLLGTGNVLPELFICLDDYPELDAGGRTEPDGRGFPAFGTVRSGLDVVAAIAEQPTRPSSPIERLAGEILERPVPILRSHFTNETMN